MNWRSDPATAGAVAPGSSGVVDEIPRRTQAIALSALLLGGVLLGLTIHAGDGSAQFYVAALASGALWIVAAWLAPKTERPMASPRDLAWGASAGVASFLVFVAAFQIARQVPLLERQVGSLLDAADRSGRWWVIAIALVNAVAEELFFRGTLVDAVRRPHRWAAGIVPYALTTVGSANIALVVAAIAMGSVFTALRIRSRGVAGAIACHVVWSMLMLTLFPRP
jgi:membrane protease YdiL (CAAX protease family)